MKKILYLAVFVPLSAYGMEQDWDITEHLVISEPNVERPRKNTLLHFATKFGWPRLTRFLVTHGWDVHARNKQGLTPLHLVFSSYSHADHFHALMASILLAGGANVNTATEKSLTTPLHLAAWNNLPFSCKVLLDYGADRTMRNKDGYVPFSTHSAKNDDIVYDSAITNHIIHNSFARKEILTLLMIHKYKTDSPFSQIPKSVLKYLIIPHIWPNYPFKWLPDSLRKRRSSPWQHIQPPKTIKHHTWLHFATWWKKENMCKRLINRGCNVNTCDYLGYTPLHTLFCFTTRRDDVTIEKIASLLLQAGSDVNAASGMYYNTPLHFAARNNLPLSCKVLLNHGADTTLCNVYNMNASEWALNFGNEKISQMISNYQS